MKTYRLLPVITGLFTSILIITETLASKIISFGPITLSVAIIIFPLSYLINDILTEVYGYKTSRRVIWTGFVRWLKHFEGEDYYDRNTNFNPFRF